MARTFPQFTALPLELAEKVLVHYRPWKAFNVSSHGVLFALHAHSVILTSPQGLPFRPRPCKELSASAVQSRATRYRDSRPTAYRSARSPPEARNQADMVRSLETHTSRGCQAISNLMYARGIPRLWITVRRPDGQGC